MPQHPKPKIDEKAARAAREKAFHAEAAAVIASAEATQKLVGENPDAAEPSPDAIKRMDAIRDHILNAKPPR